MIDTDTDSDSDSGSSSNSDSDSDNDHGEIDDPSLAETVARTHDLLKLLQDHPTFEVTLDDYHRVLTIWMHLASNVKGVAQRSSEVLGGMLGESGSELTVVENDGINDQSTSNNSIGPSSGLSKAPLIRPTIETYNLVLWTWAKSNEHRREYNAHDLFNTLEDKRWTSSDGKDETNVGPDVYRNVDTYRAVFHAWLRSRLPEGPQKAYRVLQDLAKNLREPVTIEDYQLIFDCWARSNDPFKAQRSLRLLSRMKDHHSLNPDLICYRSALWSFSQNQTNKQLILPRHVTNILTRMDSNIILPDTACYEYAIATLTHSAQYRDCDNEHKKQYAEQAHKLLLDMERAYLRSRTVLVEMSVKHCNLVLEAMLAAAWSGDNRTQQQILDKSRKLLIKMENDDAASSRAGDGTGDTDGSSIAPDIETYRLMLTILSRTLPKNRIQEGMTILESMMDRLYRSDGLEENETEGTEEAEEADPNTDEQGNETVATIAPSSDENGTTVSTTVPSGNKKKKKTKQDKTKILEKRRKLARPFNAFIRLCSSGARGTSQKTHAFQQVVLVQQLMAEVGVKPTSDTFCALLMASGRLLKERERVAAMELIFQRCCRLGLLNNNVLELFEEHATETLYRNYVTNSKKNGALPELWSRNVLDETTDFGDQLPKTSRSNNNPRLDSSSSQAGNAGTSSSSSGDILLEQAKIAEKRRLKKIRRKEKHPLAGGRLKEPCD